MNSLKYIVLFFCLFFSSTCYADPRVRPDTWGAPVIGVNLKNFYRVDDGIYRSKQPQSEDVDDLVSLGIQEVLSLREFHGDQDDVGTSTFTLHRMKMDTAHISEDQLLDTMRIIKNKQGPLLIHCWHGSDRTGVTIATYRIIFNNWSKEKALDEMIHGGFGYHAKIYPELITLIENLDIDKMRTALQEDE